MLIESHGPRQQPSGAMQTSLLMLDLGRAFYWFDEQLRARLAQRGWGSISRSQSLVLINIANGVNRPSRIAEKLGVSRQAMSQLLSEMVAARLIEMVPDPKDGRAQLVQFAQAAAGIREDALRISLELEKELERAVGAELLQSMREALRRMEISE